MQQSNALFLNRQLDQCLRLDGDVAECGVFRGASLLRLACTLRQANSDKSLIGFDSFGGFPAGSVEDVDVPAKRILSRVASKFRHVEHVPARIRNHCRMFNFKNVELVPGYFDETLKEVRNRKFCFVHLDVDLYQSYRTCLEVLYPQVVPGGMIVFDEYNEATWPGATKAIDEFFAKKSESLQFDGQHHQPRYFIQKEGTSAASNAA